MWIVKLALRRPYTFVVMALLILLLGVASIKNTPTDIFPEIDIPVVTVVWQYSGLSADQMAKQITTFSEYTISSAVDNVKNIESQTLAGIAVIRIFFQPNVRIDSAIAQVTAVSQTILRRMPPGTQPPFIIRYNASSVPILQLALGSRNLSEAQLYDYGIYRVRQAIAPVRGATLPLPYGGKPRQIMVDLDPQALLAKGLSPLDVGNAINAQNLTLPTGTATMILLFLGSWRSTFIVMVSIPLSILASLSILSLLGYTLNVMTLGGLALAIGILVDDATVELENIRRNLAEGKPIPRAILDGAQQIAVPAFVSTLAICIVFVSVVFLTGPAKYLFTPLALAVVFTMLASYLLSRTLVPVMVKYLIRGHEGEKPRSNFFTRVQEWFNNRFEKLRRRYVDALAWSLQNRISIFVLFVILVGSAFAILPIVGRDFFPTVDAGQFRSHVNTPPGTRLEESEKIFSKVEDVIREVVPPSDLAMVLDNIGIPQGINLAFSDNATISVTKQRRGMH
jgi:multidrug efflux pump subunit AcrB